MASHFHARTPKRRLKGKAHLRPAVGGADGFDLVHQKAADRRDIALGHLAETGIAHRRIKMRTIRRDPAHQRGAELVERPAADPGFAVGGILAELIVPTGVGKAQPSAKGAPFSLLWHAVQSLASVAMRR